MRSKAGMTDRCENCIHVQMCKWTDEMVANHTCDWYEEERPHGEWKPDGTCSECGVYSSLNKNTAYFCPNCGAKMSANDRQVTGKLNSEIGKSKSEIVPDYRDGWRLKEGEAE